MKAICVEVVHFPGAVQLPIVHGRRGSYIVDCGTWPTVRAQLHELFDDVIYADREATAEEVDAGDKVALILEALRNGGGP